MPATLYITVGISGSGKSKFTQFVKDSLQAVEVNADNIRSEMGDINNQTRNKEVFERVNKEINENLVAGKNVILSNTNLHYFAFEDYCKKYPRNKIVGFIMIDSFFPNLCKERIRKDLENGVIRSNVPENVIDDMFVKFKYFMEDVLTRKQFPANASFCTVNSDFYIQKFV